MEDLDDPDDLTDLDHINNNPDDLDDANGDHDDLDDSLQRCDATWSGIWLPLTCATFSLLFPFLLLASYFSLSLSSSLAPGGLRDLDDLGDLDDINGLDNLEDFNEPDEHDDLDDPSFSCPFFSYPSTLPFPFTFPFLLLVFFLIYFSFLLPSVGWPG